ncbi:MAG: glycosyltransferase [Verrucomicrobiales bacterium]|nr:glycosyltransferase [Verrucomicrobiales bacterium]
MKISIVTPFYNEEEGLDEYFETVEGVLSDYDYEIVCVDDGSTDHTLVGLVKRQQESTRIRVVELSRNFGKEAALTAGLASCSGDCVVIIDADLQDPPSLIPSMIKKWEEGAEVVLAKRSSRDTDTPMKRLSAEWFYAIYNRFADQPIPENVGDFRLLDRKVLDVVNSLGESNRFMKGILSWPGFSTEIIEFERPDRASGHTKWNYRKLFKLSADGIFAFSTVPLRLATLVGILTSAAAFIYASFVIIKTLILGVDEPGYASLMVVILTLGGIILISLGLLGEYLGRIYNEVKGRPIYVVRKVHENATSISSTD